MSNTKLYNFINEIIKTAKEKNFSSTRVNEQFDIVIKTLKIEGENTSADKINLLKKYTSGILSEKVTLSSVFEAISFEIDKTKQLVDKGIIEEPCHSSSKQYSIRYRSSSNDRCGLSSSSGCGSSSNDRCGSSSSSSCGSPSRNSRC